MPVCRCVCSWKLVAFSHTTHVHNTSHDGFAFGVCVRPNVMANVWCFVLYSRRSSFNVMFIALQNSLFLYSNSCMCVRARKRWTKMNRMQNRRETKETEECERENEFPYKHEHECVRVINTCVFDVILSAHCALSDYIAVDAAIAAADAAYTQIFHLNFKKERKK